MGVRRKSFRQICCRLLQIFPALLLVGCQAGFQTTSQAWPLADLAQDSDHSARLSCFLTLEDNEGPAILLEMERIEVLADDLWLPISTGGVKLDSAAIGEGQVFLGGRAVPPGLYHRVRLTVARGAVRQADGTYVVIADEPLPLELPLSAPLQLDVNDSRPLFITWDVQKSLASGNSFQPALTAAPPVRQLQTELVYASCPDIDTVFVVRADRNWVVDAFGVKGRPTYIAADPDSSRQRLYVLASREASVKLVDLSSLRVVDVFAIPLNDVPTYMTVHPDGRWVYLLDERSGYVSRIDLDTGRSAARVRLSNRPNYAVYLPGRNLLAVSLARSQEVVLLDPLSLNVTARISTGNSPQGLLAESNLLYIAEGGDDTVSIVDLANHRNLGRLAVGFGPRRLVATESAIYVSNYHQGTLSVLMPGQLGVLQEVRGVGRPSEMVYDPSYRRIYVTDEESAALAVVDANSNLLVSRIVLGARPFDLAGVQ